MKSTDEPETLPFTQLHEFYPETLYNGVLRMFNKDIQKHYYVSGLVQMGDRWIVRLSKKFYPDTDA